MDYKGIKKTRVVIALLFFVITSSVFLDLYEFNSEDTVKSILFLQFVPSLHSVIKAASWTALGFVIVLLINLIVGRLYCSAICPLGILQDIFAYIAKKKSRRKFFYKKRKGYPILRYSLLALAILTLIFGVNSVIMLLDPYSNFGRILTYIIRPILIVINNISAGILNGFEIYSLNPIRLITAPWLILILVVGFLIIVAYMSYKRGRLFCNTVCPVGTLLGLVSKVSFFKIQFDENKCTRCGTCVGECKSECIDVKRLRVDHSKCVDCFNCLSSCPEDALSFKSILGSSKNAEGNQLDVSRRSVIVTGLGLFVGQRLFAEMKNPKDTSSLIVNHKDNPVSPPGSITIARFNDICTGCGLCVADCPTQVLQPATLQYGLLGLMQPHMDYQSGLCNYDCKRCSEVCPTGAIKSISIQEKQLTQMGKAVFVKENCVVYTDGTDCGACSEHCPTKAVNMVPYKDNLLIPEVNQDICIGCGACEHPCPVDVPYKAIFVNGNAVHQVAQKPKEEESGVAPVEEDFPF